MIILFIEGHVSWKSTGSGSWRAMAAPFVWLHCKFTGPARARNLRLYFLILLVLFSIFFVLINMKNSSSLCREVKVPRLYRGREYPFILVVTFGFFSVTFFVLIYMRNDRSFASASEKWQLPLYGCASAQVVPNLLSFYQSSSWPNSAVVWSAQTFQFICNFFCSKMCFQICLFHWWGRNLLGLMWGRRSFSRTFSVELAYIWIIQWLLSFGYSM